MKKQRKEVWKRKKKVAVHRSQKTKILIRCALLLIIFLVALWGNLQGEATISTSSIAGSFPIAVKNMITGAMLSIQPTVEEKPLVDESLGDNINAEPVVSETTSESGNIAIPKLPEESKGEGISEAVPEAGNIAIPEIPGETIIPEPSDSSVVIPDETVTEPTTERVVTGDELFGKGKGGMLGIQAASPQYGLTFSDGWESGSISSNWTNSSDEVYGSVDVQEGGDCVGSANGGTYYLWMDSTEDGVWASNMIKTTYGFTGAREVYLTFYAIEIGDEPETCSDHSGDHGDGTCDGAFFTCDGTNWYKIWQAPLTFTDWTKVNVNITADGDFCSEVNESFAVKFMHSGESDCAGGHGIGWDDISVSYDTYCDNYISDCKTSGWTDEIYCLNKDISNNDSTCMNNLATNTVLDCQGHNIDGDDTGTDWGIQITAGTNITIKNCNITDFADGIHVSSSSHFLTVENTNLSSNTDDGIEFDGSDNLTIQGCTIYSNTDNGIDGDDSDTVVIYDNTIHSHSGGGDIGISIVDSSNYYNVSNNNISGNAYGISYQASGDTGNTFDSNTIEDSTYGIYSSTGDNGNFTNNDFTGNTYGVFITGTGVNDNEFYDNEINSSTTNAIYFSAANGVMDQYFYDNTIDGDPYYHCYNNASWSLSDVTVSATPTTNHGSLNIYYCNNSVLDNITISNSASRGLYLYQSRNVTIKNSNFTTNTLGGVYFDTSDNDTLTNSDCSDNTANGAADGVELKSSNNITIQYCNISSNADDGIIGDESNEIFILDNTISGHTGSGDAGISLVDSGNYWNVSSNNASGNTYGISYQASGDTGNAFDSNTIEDSTYGIYSSTGDDGNFTNNDFTGNTYGIYIAGTGVDDNEFYDNEINDSVTNAIYFNLVDDRMDQYFHDNTIDGDPYYHCYNNASWSLSDVTVSATPTTNYGSLNIYYCNNSVLDNITISGNTVKGLYFYQSRNVTVSDSNFSSNADGVYFDNSDNDTLTNSDCSDNTDDGIELSFSNNITIQYSNISSNTDDGIIGDESDEILILNSTISGHSGGGDVGISLVDSGNYWNVSNNNITGNAYGISYQASGDTGNTFTRNTIENSATYGFYSSTGDDGTFFENDLVGNAYGVYIAGAGSTGNLFYRNNFKTSTTANAYTAVINDFNTTGKGNYWDDYDTAGEGCNDANSDGFCDNEYNTSGTANSTDYYPYASEINFANVVPTVTQPTITPTTAYFNNTLETNTTYNDSNGDTGTVYFLWYRNETNIYNQTNTSVSDGTTVVTYLDSNNFSRDDLINVSVYANDGEYDSSTSWSSNTLTIQNFIPEISGLTLNATSVFNNSHQNLTAWWSVSDREGDPVKNITNWLLGGSFITVLNMPFEDNTADVSTNTKDYSGSNDNGTVSGATYNTTGGYDGWGAYEFDGSNDYVDVGEAGADNLDGMATATISAWIKPADIESGDRIIHKLSSYDINLDTGLNCTFTTSTTNSTNPALASVSTDVWTHVACTYDGSTVTSYVNGVAKSTASLTGTVANNANDVAIGAHWNYGVFSNYYNGTIDEVMIFNRSLTAQQIKALYENKTDLIVSQETSIDDVWSVEVTPNDGREDGTTQTSNSVTVVNNVPEITTPTITPSTAYTNDTLTVNITYSDNDSDTGTIYFRWYLNGTNIYNQTNTSITASTTIFSYLDSNNFSKDDLINVSVYVNDGTANSSTVWSSNTLTIQNSVPETTQVTINATSVNNYTTDNLSCYATIADNDSDTVYANYTWYNSSEIVLSGQSSAFTQNTLTLIASLDFANTTKNENWTCEVQAYDGTAYEGSWTNSTTNVTILNTAPETTTPTITPTTSYTNDTLTINITYSDTDSDAGTIYFEWYLNETNTYNQTNSSISSGTTVFSYLDSNNFSKDDLINVSVYVNDGTANSSTVWSSNTLTIQNLAPATTQVVINTTSQNNYTTDNLSCYAIITDTDGDSVYANYTWYNSSEAVLSGQSSAFTESTLTLIASLDFANTTKDENWTCEVQAYDGTAYEGSWTNSTTNVTILNTAPETTTPTITPTTSYTNDTLTINITYSDNDSDTATIYFLWYLNETSIYNQTNSSIADSTTVFSYLDSNNFSKDDLINVSVYANDGTANSTTVWSSNTLTIQNLAPATTQVIINTTSINNYTTDNLSCYATITDTDGDLVYANYTWYNSSEAVLSGQSSAFTQNTLILIANLSSANTTKDENWTCEVQAYDGTDYEGSWTNSTTNVTILNTAPETTQVILNATSQNNYTADNLTCYATIADNDSDSVYANYTWYNSSVSHISRQSGPFTAGTLINIANLTSDNTTKGQNWTCEVQAYDGTDYEGSWTNSTTNVTILNSPPTFDQDLSDQSVIKEQELNYDVNCSDDDNDTVTYYDNTSLFDINSSTGVINDTPDDDDEIGSYVINITCSDGEVNTSQTFTYTISEEEEEEEEEEEAAAAAAVGAGGGRITTCIKDADCPADQYCRKRVCVPYQCLLQEDCPLDYYCVDNECVRIFDLKILTIDSPIQPSEFFDFSYYIKAMADIFGDVTFNFWIEDQLGNKVSAGSDVIFVGSFEEKIESANLYLPSDLPEGMYTFYLRLFFDSYEIESYRTFEVNKEVPLVATLNLLPLPEIVADQSWEYSAVLAVNKDALTQSSLNTIITKQGEMVWSKQSDVIVNRSLLITDTIGGLERGEYQLEITAKLGSTSVRALEYFTVGKSPQDKGALAEGGQALFGKAVEFSAVVQDYGLIWIIALVVVALLGMIYFVIKKTKKSSNVDKLEAWIRKVRAMDVSEVKMREMLVEHAHWDESDVERALARIRVKERMGKHGLSEAKIRELKYFVQRRTRQGASHQEIVKELLQQGWPRKLIQPFVGTHS